MGKCTDIITDIFIDNLLPQDEYIFGTADLTGLIDKKFGDFRYGISIGRRLDDDIINSISEGPTKVYFNHYDGINKELALLAERIRIELRKANIDSLIIKPTISGSDAESDIYLKTLTVDVSHKMVATRAGLGWIGKTDLFISKDFGPRLRLVSILINQKPETDSFPIEKSRCGNCTICVERCPAGAANGILWNIHIHRDEFFDAHKCRKKCSELGKQRLNMDKRICGICISVCPIGERKNQAIPPPE
jgi:epoxyqueuosine reductase